jgi:hypothetical protein
LTFTFINDLGTQTDLDLVLSLQGDKLMRLPSHSVDTQDLVRNMSIAVDGPEEVIDAEEYLMPKSTETTDEVDSPILANGMGNGKVGLACFWTSFFATNFQKEILLKTWYGIALWGGLVINVLDS